MQQVTDDGQLPYNRGTLHPLTLLSKFKETITFSHDIKTKAILSYMCYKQYLFNDSGTQQVLLDPQR